MTDKQAEGTASYPTEVDKLTQVLKKSSDYFEDLESHVNEDSKESKLRDIFTQLSSDEKVMVLYEAILTNRVGIADNEKKLDFFRKTEKISISTWFKKVLIVSFAFMGIVSFSVFVFLIIKNGALNDISFVASFLKTINEVLNVIFLTK